MLSKEIVTVDFETEAIENRPKYPPNPVGVSIKYGYKKSKYLSWGHPEQNNISKNDAVRQIRSLWKDAIDNKVNLLFHNSKFDTEVAKLLGCPTLPWDRVHDTLFLLYLYDPHAPTLSLKPSSERLLGLPPDEQENVRKWLIDNKVVRSNDRYWGAHICKAPGKLVGKYAEGDTDRTYLLFKKLYGEVVSRGMLKAYDRERRLMPILMQNEREGIRSDISGLKNDLLVYEKCITESENWLRRKLKAKGFDFNKKEELADLLDSRGVVTEWDVTKKSGKRSTSKKNMSASRFNDKKVFLALGYRQRLSTCISTFYMPWIAQSEANGGMIHPNWNQVRGEEKYGTRTGRLSSSNPNFQNIPKSFEDKDDGYEHPNFLKESKPLPLMRKYILPDKNELWLHRDYNQQELRILGHYESDKLMEAYAKDPRTDIHELVRSEITKIRKISIGRKETKIINFGTIYGMGLGSTAQKLQTDVDTAREILYAQKAAIPGLKYLQEDIKKKVKLGLPIITWGGREYYVEPPKIIEGRMRDFTYKLLNYLIQGSASDCSKEAIIRYDSAKVNGRFLTTVHDEINISCRRGSHKKEMAILKEAMQSIEFDVPMLSDGKIGTSWGDLKNE